MYFSTEVSMLRTSNGYEQNTVKFLWDLIVEILLLLLLLLLLFLFTVPWRGQYV